ncbi:hypothetical protein [Streptomyces lydicus]|uniref:hypothetical protein n=1 Tax=Streptomyces lydicus TaxID=47763 RepID=UPI0013E96E5C|nr:hypothetical protein [Streptomyces lydicus]MCZ1006456.1 hypothetical protein [Streptomyces lydicus]
MTLAVMLCVLLLAVTFLAYVVARRRLGTGVALAVSAGVLAAQAGGLCVVADLTLANMG